ncbi:hypothetical protein U1Q18_040009 [Sarracenia purpurea var. burkii]
MGDSQLNISHPRALYVAPEPPTPKLDQIRQFDRTISSQAAKICIITEGDGSFLCGKRKEGAEQACGGRGGDGDADAMVVAGGCGMGGEVQERFEEERQPAATPH